MNFETNVLKKKKKVAFPNSQCSKHGHIDFTGFLRLIYHLKRGLILINDLILTFYFIFRTLFQSVFYRMKEQVGITKLFSVSNYQPLTPIPRPLLRQQPVTS